MVIYYVILGLDTHASDTKIRSRYLDLVKQHTPEKEPETFKMITMAYEAIKDMRSRVKTRLFGTSQTASCEDILRAITLTLPVRKRIPTLKEIIKAESEKQNR
ncbi:MAG: J domain-containing protein [Desulfobacteraceae bacterium]|jgi:DnaJ-class molecular chaperone